MNRTDKMDQDQLIESFIQCVQEKPEIWDLNTVDLNNRNHKSFVVVNRKYEEFCHF